MNDRAPTKAVHSDLEQGTQRATEPQIPIRKGQVRRAIRVADAACAAATGESGEVEAGLVMMTAILLVERLATASGCTPMAVLNKMAECFELKRVFSKTLSQRMLT